MTNCSLVKPIQSIFTPLSLGDQCWRESIVELASLHACQILGVVDFIHYLEINVSMEGEEGYKGKLVDVDTGRKSEKCDAFISLDS
jgi:hypothetical protein